MNIWERENRAKSIEQTGTFCFEFVWRKSFLRVHTQKMRICKKCTIEMAFRVHLRLRIIFNGFMDNITNWINSKCNFVECIFQWKIIFAPWSIVPNLLKCLLVSGLVFEIQFIPFLTQSGENFEVIQPLGFVLNYWNSLVYNKYLIL